ncbi:FAD-dependent 2-octaprenylphenol hydroxylase [Photobacterium aphoticum]|uniref:Oxidoreductase n=2 Tax=Photobacterium aphoticum TaxID=754436 RepID=A0A0J1GGX0_9GAMM|nr:FAD-dependent 2-octaprenylphenol hydroxylase [Photobacterium aphoticum]KLU98977.1 oxidoreductase [Photobacterium aphoticum]GHA56986.1 2-octaprenyl-6-methoxyphenol hydroxylase [Photobacterium aphoticum]
MMQSVDVAIIGGGMVGLALAAALSETELRVAVIEGHQPDPTLATLPDLRVSALSRASERILRRVGAWPGIEARRSAPYDKMQVWEQDSFAHIAFDAARLAQPNLGHIVENRVIQLALWDKVAQQPNVTLLAPERCDNIVFGETEAWLTLASGKHLTAKLVVGADGANSWLRDKLDIPLTHWDYGHSAIVANIRCAEPHQDTARQIFRPQGPLAFLPLPEPDLCSIVWSLPPLEAEALCAMSDSEFNKHLTTAFDNQLGLCQVEGERRAVPLKMRYARSFVRDRVALVGDAAHTIHPLAGQGVNLGLLDAAALAQELKRLWQQDQDIGKLSNLRPYERWRKAEAAKMIAAMQGFKDLFSGSHPAKKLVRDLGMLFADKAPGLKDEFMRRALGLSGHLPDLARQ